jgi:hypothetical protein
MSKFKFTPLPSSPSTGISYQSLVRKQAEDLEKSATSLGQELRNVQLGTIKNSSQFFRELNEAITNAGLWGDPEVMQAWASFGGQKTQQQFSSALKQLAGHLRKVGHKLPTTWNVGHKTMEPINVSISLTIMAIQDAQIEVAAKGEANTEFWRKNEVLLNRLRKLRAVGHVIAQAEKKGDADNKAITKALKAMSKNNRIDISHLKDLDIKINDGTLATYTMETKGLNVNEKAPKQLKLGGLRRALITGNLDQILSNELTKAIEDAGVLTLTGSKSIEDELGDQLVKAAVGKKKRKYKKKSKGKVSKTIKTPETKTITDKARSGGKAAASTAEKLEKAAALLASKSVNSSKDLNTAGSQKELNAIKNRINRRLPAEIRRNMGRPALINRTGQFSNSVKLLNLRDTGNTLTGQYTYTLTGGGQSKNKTGVYSTFENSARWPAGYNPKPLITKSIRRLAMEMTERKFTLRRV